MGAMDHAEDLAGRLEAMAATARELLNRAGVERWEIFAKTSVTVTSLHLRSGNTLIRTGETGIGVRVSGEGGSGFGAASGVEPVAARLAVESCLANRYPAPSDPIPPHRMLGRTQVPEPAPAPARGWLHHVGSETAAAVRVRSSGVLRSSRIAVRHGSWAWLLLRSEGFTASHRGASSSLDLEVSGGGNGHGTWRSWRWIADPADFDPERAAVSLVDRMLLTGPTAPLRPGVHDVLLHGEVAAHLLAAMEPLLAVRPGQPDPTEPLVDRNGYLASTALTLVDDRPGLQAPVSSPCDGEGLPARKITLIDRGIPRHRAACWRDAVEAGEAPLGGAVRWSYRDLPASGLVNLAVDTSGGLPPARLLGQVERAYYLLRLVAPVEVDLPSGRYRLLASGLAMRGGRPEGWHPVLEVSGELGKLLKRLDAVGTDRRWYQTAAGFVAVPTLLARRQRISEGG